MLNDLFRNILVGEKGANDNNRARMKSYKPHDLEAAKRQIIEHRIRM